MYEQNKCCLFYINDVVEHFIKHYNSVDNEIYTNLLCVYTTYKHIKRNNKNEGSCLGIAPSIEIE